MEQYKAYIRKMVEQGGPREEHYQEITKWINQIHSLATLGRISQPELASMRAWFGSALSPSTIQGLALTKPHGYAGDFEIIDRIYQHYVSPDPHTARWDHYFHEQAGPKAVRNRKAYFHTLLDRHYASRQPLRVLKIASGPGRSMFEWFTANPSAAASFQCIEIDPTAIRYASNLNHQFLDRINFTQLNALLYKPTVQYDLVWAAGIFDYFPDPVFLSLFQRLLSAVAPGGELVVGNFSDSHPSRPYMEVIGDWHLYHRSAEKLRSLAEQAGILPENVLIGSEPEGVNLFLHVSA